MPEVTFSITDSNLISRIKRLAQRQGQHDWKAYAQEVATTALRQALGAEDLSVKQVAQEFGVHRTRIFAWKGQGLFPNAYLVTARCLRIPRSDVEALKASRRERIT